MPRRPFTCHVSMNVNSPLGMMQFSALGSATRSSPTAQVACREPLLKFHRPLTEYPPSTCLNSECCGGPLHRIARLSLHISCASASGISDAIVPRMLFWLRHHAVLPSAAATACTIAR